MKKLITILITLCSMAAYSQMGIYNNTLRISTAGDVTWHYIHAVGSADSISVAIASINGIYRVIKGTGIVWREQDGIVGTADSFRITSGGDYEVMLFISGYTLNTNDALRIKMYKNNVASPTSISRFMIRTGTTTAATVETKHFLWYVALATNDRISFRITNLTGNRDFTVCDYKIYVKKLPELIRLCNQTF